MDELMNITTGRWQATQAQLAQMKRDHEAAIAREHALREEYEGLKEYVTRIGFGMLGRVKKTRDEIIAWNIAQAEKEERRKKGGKR
jgi:hypothetical protein